MENCPKCGLPVADGAKFCAACGTRMPQKLIKSKVCSVCGNTLNAVAKFCNVCGTAVPQDETPADEPVVDERNPEMESIEVPELHFDDTPVQNQTIPPTTPDMPTMDSVYLPGQEPAKPVQPAHPTAEEVAMASRTVEIPQTPTVAETPNVAPQPQQPERVLTPEGYQQPAQPVNNAMPQMNQGGQPIQPNQMNQMNGVTPGKGASALVPIILIILILAVICVDVFWLFRDQIFGKKDESSNGCAVITLADETDYPANEAFFFEE